ncbi:MAG: hypothetical protein J3R72DRAFT_461421 [Linnemannia gamsii]|nr:MAG: hypothetical protein J3R72DRAFT_461421 [Linnemannia gamsii]
MVVLHLLVVLCHAGAWGRLHAVVVHTELGHVSLKHMRVMLIVRVPHPIESRALSVKQRRSLERLLLLLLLLLL